MLENNKKLTMEDIEKNLDGNICRCTGYRPILDAFKTLSTNSSEYLQQKCGDIEECHACPLKQQGGQSCSNKSSTTSALSCQTLKLRLAGDEMWVCAKTIQTALAEAADRESVRFVAGNTSTGIFKSDGPYKKYIDINGIPELKTRRVDEHGITFGGGVTLTQLIELLKENARKVGLEYGTKVVEHLERVANVSVRNVSYKLFWKIFYMVKSQKLMKGML